MSRTSVFLSLFLLAARVLGAAAPNASVNPATIAPGADVPEPGIPAPGAVGSAAPAAQGALGAPANWAQTLERIASGVVTIQIDSTRAFDTEWNTTAQATGFVIDAIENMAFTGMAMLFATSSLPAAPS